MALYIYQASYTPESLRSVRDLARKEWRFAPFG
jgi:hypothetical protein